MCLCECMWGQIWRLTVSFNESHFSILALETSSHIYLLCAHSCVWTHALHVWGCVCGYFGDFLIHAVLNFFHFPILAFFLPFSYPYISVIFLCLQIIWRFFYALYIFSVVLLSFHIFSVIILCLRFGHSTMLNYRWKGVTPCCHSVDCV